MLPFPMFRARQPIPAPQPLRETSADSASAFTPARSGRYLPPDSFNFDPSIVNHSLTPFPATLTDTPQSHENKTTLSPAFATLTRFVNPNPFVCHSYKKHRGWGIPVCFSLSLPAALARLALTNPFRITFFAHPYRLSLMKSYSCEKQGVGRVQLLFNSISLFARQTPPMDAR